MSILNEVLTHALGMLPVWTKTETIFYKNKTTSRKAFMGSFYVLGKSVQYFKNALLLLNAIFHKKKYENYKDRQEDKWKKSPLTN